VAAIDPLQPARIYPLFWTLEPLALTLGAQNLGPQELAAMAASNKAIEDAIDAGDAVAASAADYEFHTQILRPCANPELIRFVGELKRQMRRVEIAYFGGKLVARRSVEEHARVIEAVRDLNVEIAARLLENHWRESLTRMSGRLEHRESLRLSAAHHPT
jgi:DNA-binding GntR family transcriptional regulator